MEAIELGSGYWYIVDDVSLLSARLGGSVVAEDDVGDTLLQPPVGRCSILEEAGSVEDAIGIARAWEREKRAGEGGEDR